jgi:hypothetical protein
MQTEKKRTNIPKDAADFEDAVTGEVILLSVSTQLE